MNNQKQIQHTFIISTKYAFMMAIPACIIFLLLGEAVLNTWLGKKFVGSGATLLAIMTIPQMFRAAHLGGFFVLAGLGRHKVFGIVVLLKAFTSVVLAYILADIYHLRLLGIAIGFAVPELIASAIIIPILCCRAMNLRIRDEILQCVLPALFAHVPFLLYCLAIHEWYVITYKWQLLTVLGISLIPMALGVWFLGLKREERARFRAYLFPVRK